MFKCILSVLVVALSMGCFGQTCEHIGPSNFQIAQIEFVGADSVDPALICAMIANLEKDILEECQFNEELQERIRDQFQRFGYFKVDVHNDITYRELSRSKELKKVSLRVKVDPGRQYRVDRLAFTGGTVFSADELRLLVPMKDGDIFDVEKMREGLKNLRDRYGAQGYANFTPVPNTEIDDERDRISVTFDLDEGDQFRIGQLMFDGPEPCSGARQRLLDEWAPHVGQIYNQEAWRKAIDNLQALQLACTSQPLSDQVEAYGQKINAANKTMEYTLQFKSDPK